MSGVRLDLRRRRRIKEDACDRLLIASRRKEPRDSLEKVRERLARRSGKSHVKAHG
jgi:hypothetical protein